MVRVIEGKIIWKLSEGKQKNIRVSGCSSYRGNNYSKCMKEIQRKSILVRVIGSELYMSPNFGPEFVFIRFVIVIS